MERVLELVLAVVVHVTVLVLERAVAVVLKIVVLNVFHRADVPVVPVNAAIAKVTVYPVVLVPPNARNSIFFFIRFLTLFIAIYL